MANRILRRKGLSYEALRRGVLRREEIRLRRGFTGARPLRARAGRILRMAALPAQMGSIQATAADNPLRVEFDRLHRRSVMLESGVLLAGFAAMFLLVRGLGAAA